jgi:hypothetical protein
VERWRQGLFSDIDDATAKFQTNFGRLKEKFQSSSALFLQKTVLDMSEHIYFSGTINLTNNLEGTEIDLNKLPHAPGASFQSSKRCLLGTRTRMLKDIHGWIDGTGQGKDKQALLLVGPAGTGKSAIAHTIAAEFQDVGCLGSVFCFDRSIPDRGIDKLFPTIAHDLASLDKGFRGKLAHIIQEKVSLSTTKDLIDQFNHFILAPLSDLPMIGPTVVVIDALDECGDPTALSSLFSLLHKELSQLPLNLRIILTSRPENDIMDVFQNHDLVTIMAMDDEAYSAEISADIHMYVQHKLKGYDGNLLHGITMDMVGKVQELSEGLFQFAFVLCTELVSPAHHGGKSIKERFSLLTSTSGGKNQSPLDTLYLNVLEQNFDKTDVTVMDRFRGIMGWILALYEPLPKMALIGLEKKFKLYQKDGTVDEDEDRVSLVIQYMGSLLSGVTGQSVVRPLHTSFRDFLLNKSRSSNFYVDLTTQHHCELALAALHTMNAQLCFNICDLETFYVPNKDIADLQQRIAMHIQPELSYACRFWGKHLCNHEEGIDSAVEGFLNDKFLFWLEALSLINGYDHASRALMDLRNWAQVNISIIYIHK